MGKGGGSAPPPDPQIGQAALQQAATGERWLEFSKDAFKVSERRQEELDALTKEVVDLDVAAARDQLGYSREDRERYRTTFQPVEEEFVRDASSYGSPERQAQAAAEARADVFSAAEDARQQNLRQSAALGISPPSGRFAGIDRTRELGTALGAADAQNRARVAQRDKGLALQADVANLGRGLPSQSAQAAGVGLAAGSGATGAMRGANQQYLASTAIPMQGYRGAMQGYAGQGQTLNQRYRTEMAGYQADRQADAMAAQGIGSAIGGVFGAILSDEDKKTNKKAVPEGKALEAVRDMPVSEYDYKEGVADEGRHVGPMAQDFAEQTGRGDGTTIAVQDAIGITMKAVQDLDKKVDKLASGIRPANQNRKRRAAA